MCLWEAAVKTRLVSLPTPRTPSSEPCIEGSPVVMDVLPWPNGYGFAGNDCWWQYVLNQDERERLDNLIGLALLDGKICERLVIQRDPALLSSFDLAERTQDWLKVVPATTLTELAQAIVAHTEAADRYALPEAA